MSSLIAEAESVAASRVEFPQQLIPDERIRIATDHAVPRDHVVGLNVHARTNLYWGFIWAS
jgi:hypothetical protein